MFECMRVCAPLLRFYAYLMLLLSAGATSMDNCTFICAANKYYNDGRCLPCPANSTSLEGKCALSWVHNCISMCIYTHIWCTWTNIFQKVSSHADKSMPYRIHECVELFMPCKLLGHTRRLQRVPCWLHFARR
jgi:hypothetical protein